MELKVKVFNINSNKAHKILDKCQILKEYSIFIDKVREYRKKGSKTAIKDAIHECIENGILVEYLKRRGSEVRNMLTMEYSYEKDMQVKQEEARAEGEISKAKETAAILFSMNMSMDNIAKAVNTDVTIVKKWLLEK